MTAKQFREARTLLGLSQEELARELDRTSGTVGRYDRGDQAIPQTVAMAMELLVSKHRRNRRK